MGAVFTSTPALVSSLSGTLPTSPFYFSSKVYLWPPEHEYTVCVRKDDLLKLLEKQRPNCRPWPEPAKT